MGETACTLTVIDVAELLQAGYAYISGGKSGTGCPILTFPDLQDQPDLSEDEYRNLMTYLTTIPPLEEVHLGFVVVIDRRKDKWGSVKTLLLKISGYFPGLVQEVYILRPSGFLQRTFSDMGFKFVRDDFKFKVLMCSTIEELQDHLSPAELTSELGGSLEYDHEEWVQHRAAIEKFSANTSQIGDALSALCKRLQETEFPNDVTSTENLIRDHEVASQQVRDDLANTIKHGQILRTCFKTVRGKNGEEIELASDQLPPNKLAHVTNVTRLLSQLEETSKNYETFLTHHNKKLQQCLQLRRFEEKFRTCQQQCSEHIERLSEMTDVGDSVHHVDSLQADLNQFELHSQGDVSDAGELRSEGEEFIEADHYAVDCIRPKCIELQRICEQYKEVLRQRHELLTKSRVLHLKLQETDQWCDEGAELVSKETKENQSVEDLQSAISRLDEFMSGCSHLPLSSPADFHAQFDCIMSTELKVQVQQCLHRLDEVQIRCGHHRERLLSLVELARKVATPPQQSTNKRNSPVVMRKSLDPQDTVTEVTTEGRRSAQRSRKKSAPDSSDSDTAENTDTMRQKHRMKRKLKSGVTSVRLTLFDSGICSEKDLFRHVMRELIETERIYVAELKEILEGYAWQIDNDSVKHLVPQQLKTKKQVLFGNLEEIYKFHSEFFLNELEKCKNTPALLGKCFVDRKEEFEMYSLYCQNKPASEQLRREIGDNNAFFKECQKKLEHRLPLGAYLLKPVQRVTKYQLLIKEMLKYTQASEGGVGCVELQQALDTMLELLRYVNDIMHQIAITAYPGSLAELGKLHMQGSFSVWPAGKKNKDLRFKAMQRHIFLYENAMLFCKKKDDPQNTEKASYIYKHSLKTSEIGMTENMKGDRKRFEVWIHGRAEAFIILAGSCDVKASWVSAIKQILNRQFEKIKESSRREIPTVPIISQGDPAPSSPHILLAPNTSQSKPVNNNHLHGNPDLPANEEVIVPRAVSAAMATDGARLSEEEVGWTSDEQDEDSIVFQEPFVTEAALMEIQILPYVALADYMAVDSGELSIEEGDILEVIKIGSEGWWFVRNVHSGVEGWTPASYLEMNKRASTYSNQSTVSSGSTGKTQEEEEWGESLV